MCRIAGLVLREDIDDGRLARVPHHMTELLIQARQRGTCAAGVMVVQPDGVETLRMPGPVEGLVVSEEYADLMAAVTAETIAVIGHTRLATQGSPQVNDNNHPITDRNITLVHNGVITNDEELDYRYGSVAEVDSASLAAAVRAHSWDVGGLTAESLTRVCREAFGTIATVVVDRNRPDHVFAYRNNNEGRSLYGIEGRSGYWFGSTGEILRRARVTSRMCTELPIYQAVRLTPEGLAYQADSNS